MNAFNRIFMIILSLAAVAFSIIVFLLIARTVRPAQVSPAGLLVGLWGFFAQLNATESTIAVVVCITLVILALLLLVLELNIFQREPAVIIVQQDTLGQVTVARNSVGKLVGHEAEAIEGVIETRQTVHMERNGLHVYVRALLLPEVVAPEVGHTLQERIEKAILKHMGLSVAGVQVATQLEPFEKSQRPRVR